MSEQGAVSCYCHLVGPCSNNQVTNTRVFNAIGTRAFSSLHAARTDQHCCSGLPEGSCQPEPGRRPETHLLPVCETFSPCPMPAALAWRPKALFAVSFTLEPVVLSCNRTEEHPFPQQAVKSSLMCKMEKLRGFSVLNSVLQSRNLSSSHYIQWKERGPSMAQNEDDQLRAGSSTALWSCWDPASVRMLD